MKNSSKTLVIFDFCETLINFQTADQFIDFIIENESYNKYKWISNLDFFLRTSKLLSLFNKFNKDFNLSKRLKLAQLKGISKEIVDRNALKYYESKLIKNPIPDVYDKLKFHQDNNDVIVLISGGYLPYVKVFSENHNIDYYYATEFEYKNGLVTGNFLGKDCMNIQKIAVLEKCIKENNIDFNYSISYSDSITDLPLLKWTNEGYVISKDKTQNWSKENSLFEIII